MGIGIDATVLVIAGAVILFFIVLFTFIPVGLWIAAISAGVQVSLISLVAMRLRRVPPAKIINPLIKAHKAGLDTQQNQLEAHFLAGGNVDRVVDAEFVVVDTGAVVDVPFPDLNVGLDQFIAGGGGPDMPDFDLAHNPGVLGRYRRDPAQHHQHPKPAANRPRHLVIRSPRAYLPR
jgi:hypothetical protein